MDPSAVSAPAGVPSARDPYDDLEDEAFYAPAYHPPGSGPAPTSRTSVQKVLSVISHFTEYKRFLVESTGFNGILKLPKITRMNLRFSKWLLQKIDVETRTIVFGTNI